MGEMADDGGLAKRLARDLDGSFEALVEEHQRRLFAIAMRFTADHHEAEDATQDAFVRAYKALVAYEPDRIRALDVRAWLTTIALNALRNRRRSKRPALVCLDRSGEIQAMTVTVPDAPNELATLILRLPLRMRAAIVLRYVDEMGYEEIASTLGVPVGTAKSDVHRGLARLRTMLEEDEA